MAELNKAQLLWHSRRGMRELDLLLVPFMEQCFEDLDPDAQQAYAGLLQQEDQTLWGWLFSDSNPTDPDLQGIIRRILVFAGKLD